MEPNNMNCWMQLPENLQTVLMDHLLQNPFVGLNITDGEGRVLYLNQMHRYITGNTPESHLGRKMEDIVSEGLSSESATSIVLKTGKEVIINQQTPNRNNYYQVKAVPIKNDAGQVDYVINYLIDTSDLVKLRNNLQEVQTQNELLQKRLKNSGELVYQSKVMQQVVELAHRVAKHDITVLITGPSGVGKELVANLIQSSSDRKDAPFVKINCAAIPEQLLESELFGYEPGAFTGGNAKGKIGIIESANGGTLLLDEISELPLPLQAKLLRVLQNRKLRHLGANKSVDVDFRLIASTNADLNAMVKEKKFREDLYYRLNVIELKIPGLNERKEDIVLLIDHFLHNFNMQHKLHKTMSQEAVKYLTSCQYPGNVRELQNIIQRAVVMSRGDEITLDDARMVSYGETSALKEAEIVQLTQAATLKEMMERYEEEILMQYQRHYHSGVKMAEALGVDQSTLSRKLRKYRLTGR